MNTHSSPPISGIASQTDYSAGYVWWIAVAAALGGLLFGYDWVVVGGARQFYEIYFRLSSAALVGWANSCALIGCLIGSLAAGSLANRYGRRPVLLISAILFAVSSVFTGSAHVFVSFIVWRIIGGTAIGLSSNVAPLYIAEISPAPIRGRLVSLNQFAIVIGILLAQVVNWEIARPVTTSSSQAIFSWNVQVGWRWMFVAVAVPATIFILSSLLLPESPRWLMTKGRDARAHAVLSRVGGLVYAGAEVAAIRKALFLEVDTRKQWRELLRPGVRRTVLLGAALAVLQQWTGINILFNYAGDVYRRAGYGANQIFLDIVITGAINLGFTIISMLLVDRLGRRWLMLFGCIGIGTAHILCALAFHLGWQGLPILLLTLAAIACYALTLAPVTWVLIAEIFPNRVRAQGVSVAVTSLWAASFLLTYTFPALNHRLGTAGTFLIYGVICLLGFLLVAAFVPETKGRTLEQIESDSEARASRQAAPSAGNSRS